MERMHGLCAHMPVWQPGSQTVRLCARAARQRYCCMAAGRWWIEHRHRAKL